MPAAQRYIDPLSDFGFKHLFGRAEGKPALLHLINAVLPPERRVVSVELLPTELGGRHPEDRTVFVDVGCLGADGTTFIVEVQRRRQDHFRDRSLFYIARALSREATRGNWNYQFRSVVLVAFLEFTAADTDAGYVHEARLRLADGRHFSDTVSIIHIELPKFHGRLESLGTDLEH